MDNHKNQQSHLCRLTQDTWKHVHMDMFMNIHGSILRDSPKLETDQLVMAEQCKTDCSILKRLQYRWNEPQKIMLSETGTKCYI